MGSYYIPRNVKGEGRFLNIFSVKALIYTVISVTIGVGFYYIFAKMLGLTWVGIGFVAFFGLTGFIIGTFKIPEIEGLKFTQKVGGENIDDVIIRAYKFYKKDRKIYLYTKEEE